MSLSRPLQPLPAEVRRALRAQGVYADYEARPAYQRNDYLAWIARAQRAETKEKRLRQMIDELKKGGVYMKMRHPPSQKIVQKTARKK